MLRSELARQLGESEMWVSRRINGRVPISVDDLSRIAAVLDLEPAQLLKASA